MNFSIANLLQYVSQSEIKKKETLCVDLWFLALHLQEQYQQLQIIAHHERKTNKQQPP